MGLYWNTLRMAKRNFDSGTMKRKRSRWWTKGIELAAVITTRCNLHCEYCPMFYSDKKGTFDGKYPRYKELSLEERVLRSIMEPSRPRVEKSQQETHKPEDVPFDTQLRPGVWVEFLSPLWGICSAQLQAVTLRGCVLTHHSVLKGEGEPATIPASS